MAAHTTVVSGTDILRSVRDDLARYRASIEPRQRRVTIIRFEATPADPPQWRWWMEASRISAEQKVKAFDHRGFAVDHLALAAHIPEAEFAALLAARNRDSATAAVIVQLPVRAPRAALSSQSVPQAGGKWSTCVPFAMTSLPPAQGPGYGAGVAESGVGEPDPEVGARGPAAEQVVRIETGRVVRAQAQAVVVTVAGEIDGFTVDRLRAAVAAGFDQLGDTEILVIDLTEVTFLGSQGLQALFDVTQAARRRREPLLIVVDHNRPVIRPMQLTGLDDVLALFDTVDAALDFTA